MININKRPREYSTSVQSGGVHPQGPSNVPKRPRGHNPNNASRFSNSIFNIPIQTQNSQIHQMTNNTASVPLLVRPYANDWHSKYTAGSPLFVCRSASGGKTPLHKMADIPQLNYMLLQGVSSTTGEGIDSSPSGLLDKYNFFGIYRNNMGEQVFGSRRTQQSIINFDVYGRSKISNLFSGGQKRLSKGMHVGLAVVEILSTDLAEHYDMSGKPVRFREGVPFVWQIRPTLNGKLIPSSKALANSHTIRYHIPLGIISHAVSPPAAHAQICEALRNSDRLTELPQIEILML
jgi:hypothetical protein